MKLGHIAMQWKPQLTLLLPSDDLEIPLREEKVKLVLDAPPQVAHDGVLLTLGQQPHARRGQDVERRLPQLRRRDVRHRELHQRRDVRQRALGVRPQAREAGGDLLEDGVAVPTGQRADVEELVRVAAVRRPRVEVGPAPAAAGVDDDGVVQVAVEG